MLLIALSYWETYYTEAEKLYNHNKFKKALVVLEKAEDMLLSYERLERAFKDREMRCAFKEDLFKIKLLKGLIYLKLKQKEYVEELSETFSPEDLIYKNFLLGNYTPLLEVELDRLKHKLGKEKVEDFNYFIIAALYDMLGNKEEKWKYIQLGILEGYPTWLGRWMLSGGRIFLLYEFRDSKSLKFWVRIFSILKTAGQKKYSFYVLGFYRVLFLHVLPFVLIVIIGLGIGISLVLKRR